MLKSTKRKYLNSNKAVQLDMLWYALREVKLLIWLVIVLLIFLKWG